MPNYSPYYKILDEDQNELDVQMTSLTYVYTEELEDACTLMFETDQASLVDHPHLQEDKAIHVVWGYIGIDTSITTRKIYIIDSKATFGATGLKLVIRCLPKAGYLKYNAKKTVRNNTSLVDVIGAAAESLGLDVVNQLDEPPPNFQVHRTGFAREGQLDGQIFINPDDPNDPRNGRFTGSFLVASDAARARVDNIELLNYESLPQAGKSDGKLIKELAEKEPVNNLVVSGRDDTIVIKKRDFTQPPVVSYKWNSGESDELLEMQAGVNNSAHRSAALLTTVDYFDSENKVYGEGEVKNTEDGTVILADGVQLNPEDISQLQSPTAPGNTVFHGLHEAYKTQDENGNELTQTVRNLEVNGEQKFIFRERKGATLGQLDVNGYLLESDVTSRIGNVGIIPVRYEKRESTVETTPKAASGQGQGRRSKKVLNQFSTTARCLGNSKLEEGKIVRIEGVGNKYNGNWYITRAEHIVDSNGWLVNLGITKNAIGSTDQQQFSLANSSQLNKTVNNLQLNNQSNADLIPVEND